MRTILTRLAAEWQRVICRIRESRRLEREMGQLASMSAHELRDIGFSHPAVAVAAAAGMPSRCR